MTARHPDPQPGPELAAAVAAAVAALPPGADPERLLAAVRGTLPGHEVCQVLCRGGWHRLGGVLDQDGGRIADHISEWANALSGGDVDELMFRVRDLAGFATRLDGRTHYLVAPTGPAARHFIQIEVEELQEVLDRPISVPDWFPDSIAEFVDPLDLPRLEPKPVGPSRFKLRRVVQVDELLNSLDNNPGLHRFLADWDRSSAGESSGFCAHWVLSIRDDRDRDGEPIQSAKPVPAGTAQVPPLSVDDRARGAQLANRIHGFDRQLGYPFAWYFHMLTSARISHRLAESVHADLMGAYAYLPARDLKVLRDWYEAPYGV